MTVPFGHAEEALGTRPPAVAGMFYPDDPGELGALVDQLLGAAPTSDNAPNLGGSPPLAGILVPHAGLAYSGLVAAAAWRLAATPPDLVPTGGMPSLTIVLLGTNHGAGWLTGVGAWDRGPWWTPLGKVAVDDGLLAAVLALGVPFEADARCHLGEHSVEVQLPFVSRVAPSARIVALSVGAGRGSRAIAAGERLGALLAARRAAGERILLAISTDMAHYPAAPVSERITATLAPHILALDPGGLAAAESAVTFAGERGVACGMCGIEPAILGLAAMGAMGAQPGIRIAEATSADAGGDPRRTVGYLSAAFPAG